VINNITHNAILQPLFSWYRKNKRDMPWRNTKNPYKIWLSEVILQQTRFEQGLPYYLKFVEKYPTIKHLSEAHIDEVLRLWQGLGYYSRARNLHKCAKTINFEFGGKFPEQKNQLLQLPGIGPYTAAAIASFAFGKKEAVVDGNVLRVITRLFGIDKDIGDQKTVNEISGIVNELIPAEQPDIFNHAIMEFGASVCVPKNPSCSNCVLQHICTAYTKKMQAQLPMKKKKIVKKTRYFNYLVIHIGNQILMTKRENNDIWKGLFEFYLVESEKHQSFNRLVLPKELIDHTEIWELSRESRLYKHVLTHQNIMCQFYHIRFLEDHKFNDSHWKKYRPYTLSEIEDLPKPILIDKYLGEKII
jgi:A/G-specific adenine glycosylase